MRSIGTVLLRIRGGITIQVCSGHRLMNDDPHPTLSPERAMSLRSYALCVRLIGTVLLRVRGGITIQVCNGHRLMNYGLADLRTISQLEQLNVTRM